jgi:signal transduction histidine kinase
MIKLNLRRKAVIVASLFAIIILGTVSFVISRLEHSSDEIITSSKLLTESAVFQLTTSGKSFIDSLEQAGYFNKQGITKSEERHVDSLFSIITSTELNVFQGMEGGYYFPQIDAFLGYSFPTSPMPKPAFGPPPRSYFIIREQAQQSVRAGARISQIHAFDPARFPLVTEPIVIRGKIIGCSWTRVHIERLIPTLELTDVLLVAAGVSLAGFAILLVGAWNMRKRVEEIRLGLETLHTNEAYRFGNRKGVFGEITSSINEMIEARTVEQERRETLEHNIHQQDKMATLGTLIAGVAHEVKTPLAIIKTRIQLWERKLHQLAEQHAASEVVSAESMEMVIREINRLSDLVKKLLVFSKPVNNTLRPADINQILSQTLALIQPDASEYNITVQTQLDPGIPPVHIDNQAMEQVFLNLMTNSVEAMPDSGTLYIGSAYLPAHNVVSIDIEDTGNGIASDILGKVFNPFFTTKEHGVGLGLSISYEIIRAHRGTIEFLSGDAKGTHCRIQLPIARSSKY